MKAPPRKFAPSIRVIHGIAYTQVSQNPDAKGDTQASQVSDIGGIQLTDAMKKETGDIQLTDAMKKETGDIQDTDSLADIKAIHVPVPKIETEADTVNTLSTNSKLTANPIAEPATPKPAASTAIVSENGTIAFMKMKELEFFFN
ncbi:hypothetical protein Q3G72_021378 [Acer saccharum]|nr:hypothetical protein Q3G72_021378 [Acer saccharum]